MKMTCRSAVLGSTSLPTCTAINGSGMADGAFPGIGKRPAAVYQAFRQRQIPP